MKKFGFLIFLSALIAGLMFAPGCNIKNMGGIQGSGTARSEPRGVKNFTKIEASGAVEVEVSVQKDFSVEVTADDNLLQLIKTETSGDTLKIYPEGRTNAKTRVLVKISMPELKGLDISGASTGNVSNVKADSLDLKASGASKVKIDGETRELKADANGASTIDAEKLKSENADVDANGASRATVSASGDLKVDASGASTITYTGEPKNIKQNSSGASSINKK